VELNLGSQYTIKTMRNQGSLPGGCGTIKRKRNLRKRKRDSPAVSKGRASDKGE
jgi:hypothetical protein